ncbi:MAG: glycosyltransferase family 4 protein, partial [Gemmatimonadota bacterium]
MRILLLNYEYPPLGGGAGIATRALASTLGRRGQRVDVVTSAPPDVPGASLAGAPTSRTGRLRVERVGPNVDV